MKCRILSKQKSYKQAVVCNFDAKFIYSMYFAE